MSFVKTTGVGGLIVFLVASASCTRCVDLRIFNASGGEITVVNIYPGGEDKGTIGNGQSMVLPFRMFEWNVTRGNVTWSYSYSSMGDPGKEYMSDNWFQCRHVLAQIEPDGTLWLLPPGTTSAVETMPPQPPGYPAKPDRVQVH